MDSVFRSEGSRLVRRFDPSLAAKRNFVATASCGICGKAALDEVEARLEGAEVLLREHGAQALVFPLAPAWMLARGACSSAAASIFSEGSMPQQEQPAISIRARV